MICLDRDKAMLVKRFLIVTFFTLSCGESDPVGDSGEVNQLTPGTYDYSATVTAPGISFNGMITITAVTPVALEGSWTVPGFQDQLVSGRNGDGRYTAGASATRDSISGFVNQTLGPGVECSGFVLVQSLASSDTLFGTCDIARR